MNESSNVLVVTVGETDELYEESRAALRQLDNGESIEKPAVVSFATHEQLVAVFNDRTYELLRVIRDEAPSSIRETARRVDRDVKNVHRELTRLEALGVIEFVDEGAAKRPVFPYDDLVISPLGGSSDGAELTA